MSEEIPAPLVQFIRDVNELWHLQIWAKSARKTEDAFAFVKHKFDSVRQNEHIVVNGLRAYQAECQSRFCAAIEGMEYRDVSHLLGRLTACAAHETTVPHRLIDDLVHKMYGRFDGLGIFLRILHPDPLAAEAYIIKRLRRFESGYRAYSMPKTYRRAVEALITLHILTRRLEDAPRSLLAPKGLVVPEKKNRKRRSIWLAEALVFKVDHPEWTDARIAEEVGVNPSQLSRSEEYQRLKELKTSPIVGSKNEHGQIEAEADSSESEAE